MTRYKLGLLTLFFLSSGIYAAEPSVKTGDELKCHVDHTNAKGETKTYPLNKPTSEITEIFQKRTGTKADLKVPDTQVEVSAIFYRDTGALHVLLEDKEKKVAHNASGDSRAAVSLSYNYGEPIQSGASYKVQLRDLHIVARCWIEAKAKL